MLPIHERLKQWERFDQVRQHERDTIAFLRQPLPPMNNPALSKPTKIKVRKGFWYNKQPRSIGTILSVEASLAADLVARKRVELVE
jgi:hypothetical protein